MLILQHRLATAIVAVAVAATAGFFLFARPQYRPPGCKGCSKTLHFKEAVPPTNGWLWSDPTPGFHFGEHHDEWRITSQVGPQDVPRNAGVLIALTDRPRRTEVFWHDGRCLGVTFRTHERKRLCNPQAAAVFVVHAMPKFGGGWSMFMIGVARSDVTKITVEERGATEQVMHADGSRTTLPEPPRTVFDSQTPPWWGGWEMSTRQPVPWDATIRVYGRHGLIATTYATFAKPGERLFCASAASSACDA